MKKKAANDFMELYKTADHLLQALLYEASSHGHSQLPAEKILLLSGLVKGTIAALDIKIDEQTGDFITPHPFDTIFRSWPSREEILFRGYQWYAAEAKETHGKTLSRRIKKGIEHLINPEYINDFPKGRFPSVALYDHVSSLLSYSGGICSNLTHSLSLTVPLCDRVQNIIYPQFTENERKEIQSIGMKMETYLFRDLAYWEQHEVLETRTG